jgi:hypothetical protein
MRGNFIRPRGNVISRGEDILEGVRDYPSGGTLSNVAALLQHLMQSPISNHFYSVSKAWYQNTVTTSLRGKMATRFPVRVTPIYVKQTESHIRPLTQSPLVSFCNCRTLLSFKICSCLFFCSCP